MEEPQIHMVPARGLPFGRIEIPELVEIFNNTVKGLRGKTEVWCHTCWGNPAQQRWKFFAQACSCVNCWHMAPARRSGASRAFPPNSPMRLLPKGNLKPTCTSAKTPKSRTP
jgi:hypothetical protein